MTDAAHINVVFVLFGGVTQLDFAGPAQCLARMPGAKIFAAAETLAPIPTDSGFSIVPNVSLTDCPQAHILCVPGGRGVAIAVRQRALIDFVRSQAVGARWTTAVCTGAFVLGAAGLLRGRRATTHWAYTHLLPLVGAQHEARRVVKDGSVITAGGVTSGIDFGLTLAGEVTGRRVAESIQLALEYDPAPPFDCGTPSAAPADLVKRLETTYRTPSMELEDALRGLLQ